MLVRAAEGVNAFSHPFLALALAVLLLLSPSPSLQGRVYRAMTSKEGRGAKTDLGSADCSRGWGESLGI